MGFQTEQTHAHRGMRTSAVLLVTLLLAALTTLAAAVCTSPPPLPPHALADKLSGETNDIATVTCEAGYTPRAGVPEELECRADGTWEKYCIKCIPASTASTQTQTTLPTTTTTRPTTQVRPCLNLFQLKFIGADFPDGQSGASLRLSRCTGSRNEMVCCWQQVRLG